jgi:hypothetical protein
MARIAFILALAVAVGAGPLAAVAQEAGKNRKPGERRGGYSYSAADAINTYGDARGSTGRSDSLRDPGLDRQTNAGPFDHGFFFDSATAPRGGDSPYLR